MAEDAGQGTRHHSETQHTAGFHRETARMSSRKKAKDLQGQRGCIPHRHTRVHMPWLTSHTGTHMCTHTHYWLVTEPKLTLPTILPSPTTDHNRL